MINLAPGFVDCLKIFTRERFTQRIPDAQQQAKGKANVFQRLDDERERFACENVVRGG